MKTATGKYLATAFSCLALAAAAAETNSSPVETVDFDRDVRPIFEQHCLRCHGPEKPKSDFRLDYREAALKGGTDNADDIVPGRSQRSKLIAYVSGADKDIQMPPPDRDQPLTPEQVDILRAWIDQGAPWGTRSEPALAVEVEPSADWTAVHGDKKKFRELENIHEGPGGGVGNFSMTEQLAPDERISVEGRALVQQNDFKLQLAWNKDDAGFIRGGFENWRKYYDDTGGFYPGFTPASFSSDRDLHLDIGRVWIDFGLTFPDTPQFVLGYEYQFRQGSKSTLVWGTVLQGINQKNIYPNAEDINEHTHIFKVDITREGDDWNVEDHARVEVYRLGESRNDVAAFTTGPTPDFTTQNHQDIHYTLGANTFRAEKQVKDWWLASAGVLLSRYDGTSLFNQTTVDNTGAPAIGFYDWRSEGITLERDSEVASLASLFLPAEALALAFAVQGEWTHQQGFGNVDLDFGVPSLPGFTPNPGTVDANQDRTEFTESFDAHYSGLPHTVLFAEGRLRQQSIGQFDEAINSTVDAFQERTDALNHFYDARVGFTESPWTMIEWGGQVHRRESVTGYDHLVDDSPFAGQGYPAFVRHRNITLNEIEGQLVLRPAYWLNARLAGGWNATDFSTVTDPVDFSISPGGPIMDGRTESQMAGLTLTITPGQRFYFSGTITYSHSRIATTSAASPEVVPYRGNVYTLGSSAGYVLNEKTDLDLTYDFSRSQYGQNNTAGIPLGLDFTRHELLAGIRRQLTKNLSGTLRYQFSQYMDPGMGNVNDFTAHGVFATFTYRWP